MKKFSQLVDVANPSKLVNAWKVRAGSKCFLITPAHVAVYRKNDKWFISKFLKDFYQLDWHIPVKYLTELTNEYDIAWASLPESASDESFLELSDETVVNPTNVEFFFRQPYNADGVWVKDASLASINCVIYPSPESCLLEALDIGFRGMSGAIALKRETTQILGMFVGRGIPLGLKENAELPEFLNRTTEEKRMMLDVTELPTTSATADITTLSSVIPTSFIGDTPSADPLSSRFSALNTNVEYLVNNFKRLETDFNEMWVRLETKMDILDSKVDYIVQNALMKRDLTNLLSIVALRRGLVISSKAILNHILTSECVNIKSFAELQGEA